MTQRPAPCLSITWLAIPNITKASKRKAKECRGFRGIAVATIAPGPANSHDRQNQLNNALAEHDEGRCETPAPALLRHPQCGADHREEHRDVKEVRLEEAVEQLFVAWRAVENHGVGREAAFGSMRSHRGQAKAQRPDGVQSQGAPCARKMTAYAPATINTIAACSSAGRDKEFKMGRRADPTITPLDRSLRPSYRRLCVAQPSRSSPIQLPAHIPALNGLRAFACLAVFGVHWQQFTRFSATWGPFDARQFLEHGNTGVSLLFTLSAFSDLAALLGRLLGSGTAVVASICWVEDAPHSPPYYLCLAALLAASGHVIAARDQRDILLHVAFFHNMREESSTAYNPSFWTLAVQAQAYVLMPVVIVLVLRASSWAGRAGWLIALSGRHLWCSLGHT
jgi:hypothetical protein